MISELKETFNKTKLEWIDSTEDLTKSKQYRNFMELFPNLKSIFKLGLENDKNEFHRTLKHIFRVFKVFFQLKDRTFIHETLSPESIQAISEKIINQLRENEIILPLILVYHDIGRFFDRRNHPYQSYKILSESNLLGSYNLSKDEQLLIKKIIQYHLLHATIYTGESTFYGVYALLNDEEFIPIISKKKYRDLFINLLEIFTFIDILGYNYAQIYDHYVDYYNEINCILKEILDCWPDKDLVLKRAYIYSQDWLEWRIAGALRIFQFVETKPYLTKEFYFTKLKESIKETENNFISKLNWEILKREYLTHSYKIQIKYGLAFLMILAFGNFQRMGLKIETGISYKLVLFWSLLSNEINSRTINNQNYLWNVYLVGMPHWSQIDKSFINKLNDHTIELIIKNSSHEFLNERMEYNLYLDLKQILD
jgi:hypothetical protein